MPRASNTRKAQPERPQKQCTSMHQTQSFILHEMYILYFNERQLSTWAAINMTYGQDEKQVKYRHEIENLKVEANSIAEK